MADSGWNANNTFDPYAQTFILALPDGKTGFPAEVTDIIALNKLCVQQAVIFGTQIGVTGLLLIILLLMTKRDKRHSVVFLLNATALLFILIRNILYTAQFDSIFYNFYNWELHYYPQSTELTNAMNLSAVTESFNIAIDAAIYASLVTQIRIVCCTLTRATKFAIMLASVSVGFLALTFRFVLAVFNIKYGIFGVGQQTTEQFILLGHMAKANNIVSVASIAFFSAIFVAKLAFAIHLRRKLKMKQFGPMQIIFVMGCQTMFVPLIFEVISYYAAIGSKINSLVPTVVAVFLPLSGMWASTQTNNEKLVRSDTRFHRAVPIGATELYSAKAYGSTKTSGTADTTLIDDDDDQCDTIPYQGRSSSATRGNMTVRGEHVRTPDGMATDMSEDLEMQRLKNGVVVDRTYSVRSD